MKRGSKQAVLAASGVAIAGFAFLVGRAWAGGIPTTAALRYSGTLTNEDGELLTGKHPIDLDLWDSAEPGTTPLCHVESSEILQGGRFSLRLGDDCVEAIKGTPDVWVEVSVDGVSLGTSKLGAVPYAVEAAHAVTADTATNAMTAAKLGTLAPADITFSAGSGLILDGTTFSTQTVFEPYGNAASGGGSPDTRTRLKYIATTRVFTPDENGVYEFPAFPFTRQLLSITGTWGDVSCFSTFALTVTSPSTVRFNSSPPCTKQVRVNILAVGW